MDNFIPMFVLPVFAYIVIMSMLGGAVWIATSYQKNFRFYFKEYKDGVDKIVSLIDCGAYSSELKDSDVHVYGLDKEELFIAYSFCSINSLEAAQKYFNQNDKTLGYKYLYEELKKITKAKETKIKNKDDWYSEAMIKSGKRMIESESR